MESDRGGRCSSKCGLFSTRKRENCNRSFVSSPFLKKKLKGRGGGSLEYSLFLL